jgi:cell division protein FtsL
MIKFFRKIRQQLLTENRFSKYFLYAIGEIILVVIGILIALQINNWNTNRKLSQQEASYLNRLIQENKSDILAFDAEIVRLERNNQTIANFSNAFKDRNCSDSLLVKSARAFMAYGSLYPRFTQSTSTYEDLSSTGNLGIIKDAELRDQIVAHYQGYQLVEWEYKINTEWAMPADAPLFIETDALTFDTLYTSFLFPEVSIQKMAEDLRKNQAMYTRNAALHYWINKDSITMLQKVKEETVSFVDLLENSFK